MSYWNATGVIGFILALTIGIALSRLLVFVLGDLPYIKGISFLIAGLVMTSMDLFLRLRREKVEDANRLFGSRFGGTTALPLWIVGLVAMAGGIYLLATPEY